VVDIHADPFTPEEGAAHAAHAPLAPH